MRFTIRDSQKIDYWIKDILSIARTHKGITNIFMVPFIPSRFRAEVTERLSIRHKINILTWGPVDIHTASTVFPYQEISIVWNDVESTSNSLASTSISPAAAEHSYVLEDKKILIAMGFSFILLLLSGARATGIL